MFSNMSASLITSEVIQTTVVKAKELRRHVEPLITLAKSDSVANRRLAFARLRDKAAVGKLFTVLGPRYVDRPGGYTRVMKAGFRKGDAAPIAYIELVDRPRPDLEDEPEDVGKPTKAIAAKKTVEETKTEPADDVSAEVTADAPEATAETPSEEAVAETSNEENATAQDAPEESKP